MDRVNFFYLQKVTEAELDLAFDQAEQADLRQAIDAGTFGINRGLGVTQSGILGISALVGLGVAYDVAGQRCSLLADLDIDLTLDSSSNPTSVGAGLERWLAVYVTFGRFQYDSRTDGHGSSINFRRDQIVTFTVRSGVSAATGTAVRPAINPADGVLLADVRRYNGQGNVLNADISITRRQDAFVFPGVPYSVRRGLLTDALADLLGYINNGSDKLVRSGLTTSAMTTGMAGHVSATNTIEPTDASALANPVTITRKARIFGIYIGTAGSMVTDGTVLANFTGGLVAGDAGNPAYLAKGDGAGGGDAGKLERDVSVFSVLNDVIAEVGTILEVVTATTARIHLSAKTADHV